MCYIHGRFFTVAGRLSAKDIVDNRQKLTQWQNAYYEYMIQKYPDMERGESASKTGPPIFSLAF